MQHVFLVKKGYELNEISLVQRALGTKYPTYDTLSYLVITKRLLTVPAISAHWKIYCLILSPKQKNSEQKREMTKNNVLSKQSK